MNILIVGSGGREHALAWQIAKAAHINQIWVAPGNPGCEQESKVNNLAIDSLDIDGLINFCQQQPIDLTIIGPEAPLAAGITDRFEAAGLACFGPSQAAAQLESSKAFCKDFMQRHHIPTASYAVFSELDSALSYLQNQSYPLVIKADGLAAGKGVVIASDHAHAEATVRSMMADKQFGEAGSRLVIEAFLTGREVSFIVLSDGTYCASLASSQDHKARDNGNQGPNTGGMGAFSPSPIVDDHLQQAVMQQVIQPVIDGMRTAGTPYVGFLYAGLMVSEDGKFNVLEFNCRLGDPETQPLMMRLRTNLADLCLAAVEGRLADQTIEWDQRPALGVVLTAPGYPLATDTGAEIEGLDTPLPTDAKIFHAGSAHHGGRVITASGRVLCVTALADSIAAARDQAYHHISNIYWPKMHYRLDIGSADPTQQDTAKQADA